MYRKFVFYLLLNWEFYALNLIKINQVVSENKLVLTWKYVVFLNARLNTEG